MTQQNYSTSEIRLSVSKVQTFENCPYRYKLTYIDRIKPEKISPYLIQGKDIHEIFDEVLEREPKTLDELKKFINEHPRARRYKEHMNNFLAFNNRISNKGEINLPKYREISLFDKELNIIGIIDRVDNNERTKNVIILDYKTGKDKPLSEHYFQLGVYVYSLEKIEGIKATHWGIYYSKTDTLMVEPINLKVVEESMNRMKEVRKKIMAEVDFKKKPSALCTFCDYFKTHCEGYCNGKKEVKYWEDTEE